MTIGFARHHKGNERCLIMNAADDQPASPPDHGDLPIPDYDQLPLPAVHQRIRTLDEQGLTAVLAYERAHGNRLPVVEVLESRLADLQAGATPSGGSPTGEQPETGPAPAGGSSVRPATQGPPSNPPSHGDPTNPQQSPPS